MENYIKDKIKSVYFELQGYLNQLPSPDNEHSTVNNEVVESCNYAIEELGNITGVDYSRHKIQLNINQSLGTEVVYTQTCRAKLGGLISKLHAEYFSNDHPWPFSRIPNTLISQNQSSVQTIDLQLLLEIQTKLDNEIKNTKDLKTKSFLEKLQIAIPAVTSTMQIIQTILNTAKEYGIDINTLSHILK